MEASVFDIFVSVGESLQWTGVFLALSAVLATAFGVLGLFGEVIIPGQMVCEIEIGEELVSNEVLAVSDVAIWSAAWGDTYDIDPTGPLVERLWIDTDFWLDRAEEIQLVV